jgi:hypothetical protein
MNDKSPDKKWIDQIAELKVLFPFLQDDDFQYDYGRKEDMLNALQIKLGKDRVELNELLNRL